MTAMTSVDAGNCATIGKWAFKDCTGLNLIHLPKNCTIDATAFSGCGRVYVFAPAGGSTETFCGTQENCVFMAK